MRKRFREGTGGFLDRHFSTDGYPTFAYLLDNHKIPLSELDDYVVGNFDIDDTTVELELDAYYDEALELAKQKSRKG